jgi:hypothetical protein
VFVWRVLTAPGIHEYKRCEERIVPRRRTTSSGVKCDEAELKDRPTLGVRNRCAPYEI